MFYLTYLYRELTRRRGRTLFTALGMAVGIGLVVAITAVSNGLDRAQDEILDPLASLGTDLMVTRPVEATSAQSGQGPSFGLGPGAAGGISPEDQRALLQENQSVLTDLSQLGKPGERFVHDFFLPATQLTFPEGQAAAVAAVDGVADVATGLTLLAVHQEGTVPQIVAQFQTGGETFQIERQITPLTAEERQKAQACIQEAQRAGNSSGQAFQQCLPTRFNRFSTTFTTPQRTIQQILNPPQTDITSEPYTIAGVDVSKPELALITPAQIASGRYFDAETSEAKEAVLASAYAQRKGLALGSNLNLNGTSFTVIGLATPPLGGQAADVYLPLEDLQALAKRDARANVLLVRASDAAKVSDVSAAIEKAMPGAQVTSAKDLAERVSGSLVDAANLVDRLGLVLAAIVLAATFAMASLLTLSSVAKRVRELGTLKALGWSRWLVVRQILGESLAQAILGAILGLALGLGAAAAISAFAPPLEATARSSGPSGAFFGLGAIGERDTTTAQIPLEASVDPYVLLLAIGLAVAGGIIAGSLGGMRAARLRPIDALRTLG